MPRKNPHAVALGRKGGSATSKAKADASRANGAKGGRPPKQKARKLERKDLGLRRGFEPAPRH